MNSDKFFHSVTLDSEKCKGCINCIKRCPTEAIRVRNGKAHIITQSCIDCGECIRVCPHHAKKATYDPLSVMHQFRYKIALPAPALYGQFNNLDDINIILNALLLMGFDDVYEVSKAAELVSDCTRKMMREGKLPRPIISSACPAVTRLIRVRFPELIDNILPLNAPVELAARLAKKQFSERMQVPVEEIGAIFISPCAAKVTAVKMPLGVEKSHIDAVVAISEVYPKLLPYMKEVDQQTEQELSDSGRIGVSWGNSGGEAAALLNESYLAADGVENVIRVLEDLEDEKFSKLEFVELNACSPGCVGGVLTVENPYVARSKLKRLRKYLPVACNHIAQEIPPDAKFDTPLVFVPVLKLDNDISVAMEKMKEIERITANLQGLDCGSCGAPSCRALAEDVVRGLASEDDCIFKLRRHMHSLVDELAKFDGYIPPPFRLPEDDAGAQESQSY